LNTLGVLIDVHSQRLLVVLRPKCFTMFIVLQPKTSVILVCSFVLFSCFGGVSLATFWCYRPTFPAVIGLYVQTQAYMHGLSAFYI